MTEKRKQCEMLQTVGADSQGHKGELASSRKAHSTSTVRKKKVAGEEPGTCRSNRILRLVVGR